jgi:hypothetical protein
MVIRGRKLVAEGRYLEKMSSLPYRFWIPVRIYDAATSLSHGVGSYLASMTGSYPGIFASGFFVAVSNLASL